MLGRPLKAFRVPFLTVACHARESNTMNVGATAFVHGITPSPPDLPAIGQDTSGLISKPHPKHQWPRHARTVPRAGALRPTLLFRWFGPSESDLVPETPRRPCATA